MSGFGRLHNCSLTVKASKVALWMEELEFLGHHVFKGVVTPGHENAKKLLQQRVPTNRKQLQSFLGMVNYFRRFVKEYAEKSRCLYRMLRKDVPFVWDEEKQEAYDTFVHKVTSLSKLYTPDWDKPFVLETDASDTAIAEVLMQDQRPI